MMVGEARSFPRRIFNFLHQRHPRAAQQLSPTMFSSRAMYRTNLTAGAQPFISRRATQLSRPRRLPEKIPSQQQIRSFGGRCDQFDPGVGGPYGQEVYPYAKKFHKQCAIQTGVGIVLSGFLLYGIKRFQRLRDSVTPKPRGKPSILIYDPTKGALDDVKLVRPEELSKLRVVG